jgi:hypothetical protein
MSHDYFLVRHSKLTTYVNCFEKANLRVFILMTVLRATSIQTKLLPWDPPKTKYQLLYQYFLF